MRKPQSIKALEALGRVRLSPSFFMRDFLYSEIAQIEGIANIPEHPDAAIEVGRQLCEHILEPLQAQFGRISIRSGYRSPTVNQIGNAKGHNCASNETNYGHHIWDYKDSNGHQGATACIIVNAFIDYYERTGHWQALAWWIHDNIPGYANIEFFTKFAAFNIRWCEQPEKKIYSHIAPKGILTKPGEKNFTGDHSSQYQAFLDSLHQE